MARPAPQSTDDQQRELTLSDHHWLARQRKELEALYLNQHVAIYRGAVVGHSESLLELDGELRRKGLEEVALLAFIEPPGWKMGL